ncbi:hypothetical protein DID75_04530 [Candidatus Marinamargulisbacteria bacterium SCGC AG-410-N11]|nr:hypothetical protein DID75_04530 [Candidatus Marinamargulisbacteria bacterium SCGC AG-410-N11]
MKNWKKLQKISGWLLISLGSIHNISSMVMLNKPITNPKLSQAILLMQEIIPDVPTSNTLWDFHLGFSFLMGWLIIGFGLNSLLQISILQKQPSLAILNITIASLICLYSIVYFFILPVLFSVIASILFIRIYYLIKKTQVNNN